MDLALIAPTFRNSAFHRPPRSLQNSWGLVTTSTRYYVKDGQVRVALEDTSLATTGLSSVRRAVGRRRTRRQRGGAAFTLLRRHAASCAYANRPTQWLDRSINRGLWRVRNAVTPKPWKSKLALGEGAGVMGLGTLAGLSAALGNALVNKIKKNP